MCFIRRRHKSLREGKSTENWKIQSRTHTRVKQGKVQQLLCYPEVTTTDREGPMGRFGMAAMSWL